jgi:AMP nucleosidase
MIAFGICCVVHEVWRSTWRLQQSLLQGFANHISTRALLLLSDQPMIPEGVKTEASDQLMTANNVGRHIKIGIAALKLVRRRGRSVKHLHFEDDFDAGHET